MLIVFVFVFVFIFLHFNFCLLCLHREPLFSLSEPKHSEWYIQSRENAERSSACVDGEGCEQHRSLADAH